MWKIFAQKSTAADVAGQVFGALFWLAVSRVLLILALRWQGRRWWCRCGKTYPWVGETNSSHFSQHLFDPYSFMHLLHGMLLNAGIWLVMSPWSPFMWRLVVCLVIEGMFELFQSSETLVEHRRKMSGSRDYQGDSIGNCMGDSLCCALGFILAYFLGFKLSLFFYFITEAAMLFTIGDNLTLNMIQMVLSLIPGLSALRQSNRRMTERVEQ